MAKKPHRVGEAEIGLATLRIAAAQPNGIATLYRLKKEIPDYVNLSAGDWEISTPRPNEPMWQQIIRNIKSHDKTPGNIICEGYAIHVPRVGYQITNAGRAYLKRKGY